MKALMLPKILPFAIPKTLGGCADELFSIREEKKRLTRLVDELEERESTLREHIIATLPKSDLTGASGNIANVRVVTKDVPQVKDWDSVYAFIQKRKAFHLLQRRLSEGVVKEYWDDDVKIPGVEHFNLVSVSLTKL